jgi:hypothetical protein
MHRLLSRSLGPTIAPVGQAVMQRTHEPQDFRSGASGSSSAVVSSSASSTQEPAAGVSRLVLLPNQPRPARAAKARSARGP